MAKKQKRTGVISMRFSSNGDYITWLANGIKFLRTYGVEPKPIIIEPEKGISDDYMAIIYFEFMPEQGKELEQNGLVMVEGPEYIGVNFVGELTPKEN